MSSFGERTASATGPVAQLGTTLTYSLLPVTKGLLSDQTINYLFYSASSKMSRQYREHFPLSIILLAPEYYDHWHDLLGNLQAEELMILVKFLHCFGAFKESNVAEWWARSVSKWEMSVSICARLLHCTTISPIKSRSVCSSWPLDCLLVQRERASSWASSQIGQCPVQRDASSAAVPSMANCQLLTAP